VGTRGQDGKRYPVPRPTIVAAEDVREAEKAQRATVFVAHAHRAATAADGRPDGVREFACRQVLRCRRLLSGPAYAPGRCRL